MAKRITTDAKIVLERAGYVVEYVYGKRNKMIGLRLYSSDFLQDTAKFLTVNDGCWIDNDLIEEILSAA
jgi:hypothetical protein